MAVDEQRWAECEITWQRSHVSCSFVAVARADGDEVMRSEPFRRPMRGGEPAEEPGAVARLTALEETLVGEGWERIDAPHGLWYAHRFRRPVVSLTHRIAPYHAGDGPIALVDPSAEAGADTVARSRLEAERLEAARIEA